MRGRVKVFFDGGCRGDTRVMELAVVAAGRTTILHDLGPGTSIDAEWLALIHAVTVAQAAGWTDHVLIGDAADVIAKARGEVTCRGSSVAHLAAFHRLTSGTGLPHIRYIRRAQNLAGIALAKGRRR